MPRLTTLTAPPTTDTGLPGLGGRRVWGGPAVTSHAWLVLTPSHLYLLPANFDRSEAVRHAIDGGATPDAVFGNAARRRLLTEVTGVEYRLGELTATIRHADGDDTVQFADAEVADDFFARLLSRTRGHLKLNGDVPSPLTAARPALGLLAGVLLATATLAVSVNAAADLAVPGAPAWLGRWLTLLSTLDWRGVCGVGGAAAACLQVAAYRAYHRPPARLALVSVPTDPRVARHAP